MEKGYVSFSFDDGRIDNYNVAYPILKNYNLPATFNITTGYVEGKFQKGRLTYSEPMNMQMVDELYRDPLIEIAGHGYWHENTIEDILKGGSELKFFLKSMGGISGFASPGTAMDMDYYHGHKKELNENGIEYVRLSLRYLSNPRIKTFIRKLSRVLPFPMLYRLAYQDTLMDSVEEGLMYSVPVLSSISVAQLKSLISYTIKQKKVCILMLHSIVEDGKVRDNWDYEKSKFESLCHYLFVMQQQGQLEVITSQKAYELLKSEK